MRAILLLNICIILFSCEENKIIDEPPCLPPPELFNVYIQDSLNNDLIGTTFNIDSIKLYNFEESVTIFKRTEPSNYFSIAFEQIISDEDYFLQLSSSEIDTIQLQWHSWDSGCHGAPAYEFDSIKLNGKFVDSFLNSKVVLNK